MINASVDNKEQRINELYRELRLAFPSIYMTRFSTMSFIFALRYDIDGKVTFNGFRPADYFELYVTYQHSGWGLETTLPKEYITYYFSNTYTLINCLKAVYSYIIMHINTNVAIDETKIMDLYSTNTHSRPRS